MDNSGRLECNVCKNWRDTCPYTDTVVASGVDPFDLIRNIYDESQTYEADMNCPKLLHQLHAELEFLGLLDRTK